MFVVMLAITLAIIAAFWVMVPPTYLTNDDVGVKRDIEGLTTPDAAPTGYVLVAHSVLGWTLVWLQRIAPVHSWDFVIGGLFILAIAVLVTEAWSMAKGVWERAFGGAALLSVVAPMLAGMQFTISATLGAIAGVVLFSRELLAAQPRSSVVIAGVLLLVVAFLVRPMAATAGALLVLVLLLPNALASQDAGYTLIRRLASVGFGIAICAGALVYIDQALYQLSPAWNAYRDDTWMTARLFEWGGDLPSALVDPLRTQLGWTPNDWELLRRWWGIDPVIHSHDRVVTLYRAWSSLVDWQVRFEWLLGRAAADLTMATFTRLLSQSGVAIAAAMLAVASVATMRGTIATLALMAMFVVACVAIEIGFKELPFRLFAPLQVGFVVAALITCNTLRRSPHRGITAACTIAAVALFATEARAAVSNALADRRQSREIDAQVADVMALRPSLLVLHADSFPSEHWWRPFHTPPLRLAAIQLGLNNHNPYVQRFLMRYDPSLLRTICVDPSILVVSERGRLDPVSVFMREHYGVDVDWSEVYQGSFRVWRCSATKVK